VFFINVPVGIASLLLSSRVLVDPPHLVQAKKRAGPVDTVGLGLIAVGLGALEYVLDKGQEEDWFNSHTIAIFATVAAVALVSFVVWEWRQKHPVVEVRLFRDRNFAIANLMMLVMGMTLYGSTVLLPQYLQVWLGYSAQEAGMVLSPGGVTVILLLPLVGRLISKVDARYLIAFGFLVLSAALLHMAHTLYPGIDFRTAVLMRVFQSCGLAFLFVPINSTVYNGVPPEKNNQVSGIVNLARNMGGDIGIAVVTTLVARRSQFHQAHLVEHVVPSGALEARIAAMAQHLQQAGIAAVQATKMAYGMVYAEVTKQAQTLAYLDVLVLLAIVAGLMVPAVLLTRRVRAGAAPVAH
jgi:DHA2 family multidrug resistance protein